MDKFDFSRVVYLKPKHWNYPYTTKYYKPVPKLKVDSDEWTYELRRVGAYVRKLPEGCKASPGMKDTAKRYCLDLREGYTLVSSFNRKQRVRKEI